MWESHLEWQCLRLLWRVLLQQKLIVLRHQFSVGNLILELRTRCVRTGGAETRIARVLLV